MAEDFLPYQELPNRCVSCAYFCRLDPYKYVELRDSERQSVVNKRMAKTLRSLIRCYKQNLPNIYNNMTDSDDCLEKVSNTVCPTDAWQLHHDGVSPEVAYQHEQLEKSLKTARRGVLWGKWAFWAVLVGIGVTILLFVVSRILK